MATPMSSEAFFSTSQAIKGKKNKAHALLPAISGDKATAGANEDKSIHDSTKSHVDNAAGDDNQNIDEIRFE